MKLLLDVLFCCLVEWVILLSMGLVPAIVTVRHLDLSRSLTALLVVGFATLSGWLAFWGYFSGPGVGHAVSTVLLLGGMALTFACLRKDWMGARSFLRDPDASGPLLLILAANVAYTGILLLVRFDGLQVHQYPQLRFFPEFTPDNLLPFIFAERLAKGEAPSPLLEQWLSSDRPPLQTGFIPLQWPFAKAARMPTLCYQVASTMLQLSWLPAIWALCRANKLDLKKTAFVVLCCLLNGGFFFFNSVYSWPKLLAGSFAMLAYILVFHTRFRSNGIAIVAGAAAALAMLAHGGSIFGLLPLALVAAGWFTIEKSPARIVLWKRACLAAGAAVLTYFPWVLYQKLIDPPGDRLIKYHLGGVTGLDSRHAFQAIREAYASRGWNQFWEGRLENLRFILHGAGEVQNPFNGASADVARYLEWQHHGATFGILMTGFVIFPLLWGRRDQWPSLISLTRILVFCTFGMTLWIALMFEPASTKIHHGSYLLTMMLIFSAATAMSLAPRVIRWPILTAQAVFFTGVWGVNLPGSPDRTTRPLFLAVALGLIGICMILYRTTTIPDPLGKA